MRASSPWRSAGGPLQVGPDEGKVACDGILARAPRAGWKVSGEPLPLAAEVLLEKLGGYRKGPGSGESDGRVAPVHVWLSIGKRRREAEEEVGAFGRIAGRERPVMNGDAD